MLKFKKYFRIGVIIFFTLFLIVILLHRLSCSPYSAISILGPSDKPDLANMDWIEIRIKYWIKKENENNYRTNKRIFIINDSTTINELKRKFKVKEIRVSSLGHDDQILITMSDGKKWQGDIIFEDRIGLCLQNNTYYSYTMDFIDTEFYRKLFELSINNEKQNNPNVTNRNIVLCR